MSTFPDLSDPTVVGPARAVALADAATESLKRARRCEPGRPQDRDAYLAEARALLAELETELRGWEKAS